MAYGYPSSNNTFVPSHEASGALVFGFSRNPSQFPVMEYLQRIPVKKSQFYVLNWNSEEGARIRSTNDNEHKWHDGHDAPSGIDELESFQYQLFQTERYAYPFLLGDKSVEQADWNIIAAQAGVAAMTAMTSRSLIAYNKLNTASFATDTATNLGGGSFKAGTPSAPYLRKGLLNVAGVINKATLGIVQIKDLCLVMNPITASGIAASQEISDLVKYTAGVPALNGEDPLPASNWGLPRNLYGFRVCVDDTVINTTAKGATQTKGYIIPDGNIYVVFKNGGLEGVEGAGSWSTLQGYFYEEFTVETKYDADNRVSKGRVVTDYSIQVPDQGLKAGYKITGALA